MALACQADTQNQPIQFLFFETTIRRFLSLGLAIQVLGICDVFLLSLSLWAQEGCYLKFILPTV